MELDFFFTPNQQSLFDELRSFVSSQISPLVVEEEAATEATFRLYIKRLAEAGLLSYAVPRQGEVLSLRAVCLIREALGYASPLADLAFVMQGLGSFAAINAGAEALSHRISLDARAGDIICAFALTEPDAGSDVAAIKSRATRVEGGYLLNGEKIFISNAPISDGLCYFASTNPEAGGKGLTAFWLEKGTRGLHLEPIELISPHPIGRVIARDVFIPLAQRIGAEGDGMRLALGTLDFFRTSVGAAAAGMAKRALDESVLYCKKRVQFGKPIADKQAVQGKLAKMATELEASRLLVYRAAFEKDRGAGTTKQVSMAKLYATEAAFQIIDDAVQLHGGYGLIKSSITERLYREIRALRIYEGTSEIQHLVIAGQLLRS